jgi:hypothetical protein
MIRSFAIGAFGACVACGNLFEPMRVLEMAHVTDDALVARAGGPKPPPESYENEARSVEVRDGEKARFAPSDPTAVKLVAGVDEQDAYVVLGLVFGGETGQVGPPPSYVEALKSAAAAIGADTVLDVHVTGRGLAGLAARRKLATHDAGAW